MAWAWAVAIASQLPLLLLSRWQLPWRVAVAVAVAVGVNVAVGGTVGVGLAQPPPATLISTEVVVLEPVYPPTATAVLPTSVPAGNERCWPRDRPAGPAVGSRIIHLQGVGRIRVEQPLQPCSYSLVWRM